MGSFFGAQDSAWCLLFPGFVEKYLLRWLLSKTGCPQTTFLALSRCCGSRCEEGAVAEPERDPAQDALRSLSEPRFLVACLGHSRSPSGMVTSQ